MPEGRAYKAGEALRFSLVLSQPVIVVGRPVIDIVAGTVPKSAVYVGGSGTKSLTFQYVVGRNDNAAVVVLGGRIALPTKSTTIRDAARNNLPLTIPGGPVPHASLDTVAPTIRSITAPPAGTYRPGDVVRFTVIFSEAVRVTGTAEIGILLDRKVVRQAQYAFGTGSRVLTFEYVVQSGDSAANGLRITPMIKSSGGLITDVASNVARLTFTPPVLRRVVVSPVSMRQATFAGLAGA